MRYTDIRESDSSGFSDALVLCGAGRQAEGAYTGTIALTCGLDIVADVPEGAVV